MPFTNFIFTFILQCYTSFGLLKQFVLFPCMSKVLFQFPNPILLAYGGILLAYGGILLAYGEIVVYMYRLGLPDWKDSALSTFASPDSSRAQRDGASICG